MARERVRFPAREVEPLLLEGELWVPDADGPVAGVVVAHPHPQRGGSMENNVVMAVCEGVQAARIAWLRFNFRGVGRSEGTYGGGIDEIQDVLGALAFLAEQPGIAPGRVGLAGYSFAARVSLAAVTPASQAGAWRSQASLAAVTQAPELRALLCVSPPLQEPLPAEGCPACPFLVLVGDRDGVVARGLERYTSYLPDPQRVQVVPGADHFWWGFETVVADAARRFFAEALAAPATTPGLAEASG